MVKWTYLKPHKAIGAHIGFADTWNYIVDFIRNLKGDADVNSETGYISVDRSTPNRPVLRLETGAGGGAQGEAITNGCYSLVGGETQEGSGVYSYEYANCYYTLGAKIMSGPGGTTPSGCIHALRINADDSDSMASLVSFSGISSLESASENPGYILIPLYQFASNGEMVCDFRCIPHGQSIEILPLQ